MDDKIGYEQSVRCDHVMIYFVFFIYSQVDIV